MDTLLPTTLGLQLPGLTLPGEAERLGTNLANRRGGLGSPQDLQKAARAFESYFVSYMLKAMRETVPEGLLPNKAGEHFRSFYDQELGRLSAQAGGLGIAKLIEEHYSGENFYARPQNPSSLPLDEPIQSATHLHPAAGEPDAVGHQTIREAGTPGEEG